MNCQQAENHIYHYCEANLSPELCLQLEEHLKACENCRHLVELTKMENAVLKDALALDYLDDQFTRRVMNAVSARNMASTINHKPAAKPGSKRTYWHFAVAAAIVLLFTAFAPGIYNNMFNENSQMDIALKDTAKNQDTVDKALEIAREAEVTAGAGVPQSAASTAPSAMDAGNAVQNYASTFGSGTVATENDSYQNNSPASIVQNAPVKIAMIEAPSAETLQDTNGITRSDPSVAYKTASPNRYRSYTINVADSMKDYSLLPVDLPDNYVLEKSLNEDSAVVYIYSETNSNQAVELSIEPYTTANSDILTLAQSDLQSGNRSVNEPLTQHLEVIFEYENTKYLVKLKSSLGIEELLKLAEEIRLGEQ